MQFAHPSMLNFLWILPALIWGMHAFYKRRISIISSFIENDLLPQDIRKIHKSSYRYKAILLLVVFVCSIIALARPQWGFHWQEVTHKGLDILIAVDVSKSMLTQDVKPDRLQRTKLAIKDLIRKLNGDRVGLIAFAGEAFLVCPLTSDYNGFMLSLDDLSKDTIPRGGSDLSNAIDEALKDFGKDRQGEKTLILVTDGEENEGDANALAQKAKAQNVVIYTVGIGTQSGELIQLTTQAGQPTFLKDSQGNFVKSRLNEHLLQKIAYTTGGAYVRPSGAQFGLDYLYDQQLAKKDKYDIQQKKERKFEERFGWFVIVVIVALLMESSVSVWKTS